MGKLEKLSLEQWMSLHVKDPDVKYCMAAFSGYYGLAPSNINALFYAIATGEYLVHGGQYYKTRSQDLSDTLAQAIEEKKGKILYNTMAEQILFDENNAIKGVVDSQGKAHPAKAVIANCSVPVLFDRLIPKSLVPVAYTKKIEEKNTSLSSFVVFLGLNKELSHIKDYEIDLSFKANRYDNILASQEDLARSDIGVTIYDNLFKGYSGPGKTTLTVMSLADYGPWKKFQKDYFNDNKVAYNREKNRIAASFVKRLEETLIPGLSDMIEVMEVGTPLTNMFYTQNPGGAIYGFDRDMEHLATRTPVKGLYLASAWSHGGGYTPVMMAGREAASEMLKDFKS